MLRNRGLGDMIPVGMKTPGRIPKKPRCFLCSIRRQVRHVNPMIFRLLLTAAVAGPAMVGDFVDDFQQLREKGDHAAVPGVILPVPL
jgi:hypothetical protein